MVCTYVDSAYAPQIRHADLHALSSPVASSLSLVLMELPEKHKIPQLIILPRQLMGGTQLSLFLAAGTLASHIRYAVTIPRRRWS